MFICCHPDLLAIFKLCMEDLKCSGNKLGSSYDNMGRGTPVALNKHHRPLFWVGLKHVMFSLFGRDFCTSTWLTVFNASSKHHLCFFWWMVLRKQNTWQIKHLQWCHFYSCLLGLGYQPPCRAIHLWGSGSQWRGGEIAFSVDFVCCVG